MEEQTPLQHYPTYQQKFTKKAHPNHYVRSVAFSPDSQHLASAGDDQTIKLWEVKSEALLNTLQGHSGPVRCVAFSPNGQHLASASEDKTIRLWDQLSGAHVATLVGHSDVVHTIAFSPDGALLASASRDHTVRLWGVDSQAQIAKLDGDSAMYCAKFSSDGRHLASGSSRTVQMWEVASGALVKTLSGHTNVVFCVAFSPDGGLLASGSDDETVRLWSAASAYDVATVLKIPSLARSIAFSLDGTILASGSYNGTISLWNTLSKICIATVANGLGWMNSIALSPDGSHLASGLEDGTVRLWQRIEQNSTEAVNTSLSVTAITPPSAQHASPTESTSTEIIPAISGSSDISSLVTLADNDRISSGGFGDLFLGTHKDLGKVAMKRPHVVLSEAALRRFLREVSLWRTMSHRYILPCLGTCKIGREVYMISPFVENGDLMSCMQRGMVLNRSKLLYEVAEALAHLHHRGIVHGDVKAQNVLVSDDGSALLCDFGLAKAFDTMATSTEVKGAGSIRWMAPELLHGESRSMASDVYSFGATIAEVLSGRPPFDHLTDNVAVMVHILMKNGKPAKEPATSPEGKSYSVLWDTAEKCWVTEPKDRPFMAQVLGMLFPLTREK